MIPESIKIDDNGDFEIIENDGYYSCFFSFTFEEIEEAYLLAKSKREQQNKHIKYGCHVDVKHGQEIYNDCVFDNDRTADCTHACDLEELGKCKTDCEYWRSVEVKK